MKFFSTVAEEKKSNLVKAKVSKADPSVDDDKKEAYLAELRKKHLLELQLEELAQGLKRIRGCNFVMTTRQL